MTFSTVSLMVLTRIVGGEGGAEEVASLFAFHQKGQSCTIDLGNYY